MKIIIFLLAVYISGNLAAQSVSDLSVDKMVDSTTPPVGSNIVFTITASNNGPDEDTNVRVQDLLPTGYTYVSHNTSDATIYNQASGEWNIGNLAVGSSNQKTLTITAIVTETDNYTNVAVISGNNDDSNLSNNTASVTVREDCIFLPGGVSLDHNFNLYGHANIPSTNIAGGPEYQIQLTRNAYNQTGIAWTYKKISFLNSFTINMKVYLGTNNVNGADGIAIVFQNSPQGFNAIGAVGGGLGARTIANGIALTLDTWQNTEYGDPTYDHGSIRRTSNWTRLSSTPDTRLGNGQVEDGQWHDVEIIWNAATRNISYKFDGVAVNNYTFPATGANAIETILNGTSAYFGYSASTGINSFGGSNDQRIGFDGESPFDSCGEGEDLCVKPGATGAALLSSVGILTKGFEPSVNEWPETVPNGYLVLDAANKGMVITHMNTAQIEALTPIKGMVVYNTDLQCVQIYRGNDTDNRPNVDPTRFGWECIERGCNE